MGLVIGAVEDGRTNTFNTKDENFSMRNVTSGPSNQTEIDQRLREFWEDHRDFDPQWMRNLLHNLSEFLPFLFEYDAAGDGLRSMYAGNGIELPDGGMPDVEDLPSPDLRRLKGTKLALALRAYAFYGLLLKVDDFHDVFDFISHVQVGFLPSEWIHDEDGERTILAALARWKLDHRDAGNLTPDELAALVGLRRKNIVNLLGKRGPLQADKIGEIAIESARPWLSARRDFRPSVWRGQTSVVDAAAPTVATDLQDPVFVPVAADGSWFSPRERNAHDGCYHVGTGEREEKLLDYWSALELLSRAAAPHWRYRNSAKRWRVKRGAGAVWARKSRHEIESLMPSHTVGDDAGESEAPEATGPEALPNVGKRR